MPMSQFDTLLPFILKHEGVSPTNPTGYADIPNDPGGETNWGISQRAWGNLRVKPAFTGFPGAVKLLTKDQAATIYKTIYYLPIFDRLEPGPALVAFDCEVNQGLGIKILQRAIGTVDDGIWGPASDAALYTARRSVTGLTEQLLWKRLEAYAAISKGSVINASFLARLWIPRLMQCRLEARTV